MLSADAIRWNAFQPSAEDDGGGGCQREVFSPVPTFAEAIDFRDLVICDLADELVLRDARCLDDLRRQMLGIALMQIAVLTTQLEAARATIRRGRRGESR